MQPVRRLVGLGAQRLGEAPLGVQLTHQGLEFGDIATLPHEVAKQGGVLAMRVDSASQGSIQDFAGFELDDPYKKRGNYYYVRVSVRNAGKKAVGGFPVPLWGISGDNTLLQAVEFKSSFAECPTEPLPAKWEAFGWHAQRVDGNDIDALVQAFDTARTLDEPKPRVIICDTKMAKGVPFLEAPEKSHFLRVEQHEWKQALEAIGAGRTS